MKSFTRNTLTSNPSSRKKRLALTLLVSFCLAYMGQAFATPMICMMPVNDVSSNDVSSSAASPCHQMMSEASDQSPIETMDCCDQMDSDSDGLIMTSHDCACPDGGCGVSLIFVTSFSSSALTISEQPDYYSTIGFPSQIDSALFRPPIA